MQINATSMMAQQQWMNGIGNNIANVNTGGYQSVETTISQNGGSEAPQAVQSRSSAPVSETTSGTEMA